MSKAEYTMKMISASCMGLIVLTLFVVMGCDEVRKTKKLRAPDRFSIYSEGRFDSGKLDGFNYEIYIDTKTGQKYMSFNYDRSKVMFPIIESKELIDADMTEMLKSESKEER